MKKIEDIEEFQGNLKDISQAQLDKLKKSILTAGIIMPIFTWKNKILDGHQRLKAVRDLLKEGHTLPKNSLPCLEVDAKDRKEAARAVLLYSSKYAVMSKEGLAEFSADFGLDMPEIGEIADLEVDFGGNADIGGGGKGV